ncbi:MAG: hypothetical protein RJQ09_19115 [Cyclobacteriaceae bacterium]
MKKVVFLIGFSLMAWTGCLGQDEKIKIESTTETMDTAQFSGLVKTYNSIIRAKEEKLRLFKIDLLGPFGYLISNWEEKDNEQNALINLAYEQKIKPNWSWVVGSAFIADRADHREIREEGGIRYYYNMQRRMLKGKSANNFSANYISSGFAYGHQFHENDNQILWRIMYGIQRRTGKRGFFDLEMGFEHGLVEFNDREDRFTLEITFKWGLAY